MLKGCSRASVTNLNNQNIGIGVMNLLSRNLLFNTTAVLLFLILSSFKQANAHALEQSYVFLTIGDTSIEGRVEITIADFNQIMETDLSLDKSLTEADLLPYIDDLKRYFYKNINIDFQQGLKLDDFYLHSIDFAQYIAINFKFDDFEAIPESVDFQYSVLFDKDPDHIGMVIIENDWRAGVFDDEANVALIFKPGDTQKSLNLADATVTQGYWEMFKLGIHHILEGIDHILFLMALLLPAVMYRVGKDWQPTKGFYPAFIYVVKVVTVFTLAHTITLSAATLGWLSLPSRLVESIIAISIAVAAVDMLYPVFRGRIWLVVFVFGLFHGFGFASVLADYQIPDSYLTLSLLFFNLGVEAGQVAIILVVFPVLYWLRNLALYPLIIMRVGAVILILVSLYWFIERGFLIDLPLGQFVNWILGK